MWNSELLRAVSTMLHVIVGPALFLTCPMDVEKSQKWFGDLWNYTIVPYLSQVNKESAVRVCIFVFEELYVERYLLKPAFTQWRCLSVCLFICLCFCVLPMRTDRALVLTGPAAQ